MDDFEKTNEVIDQTEQNTQEEEKKAAGKKRGIGRKLLIVILLAILAVFVFFVGLIISVKNSSSPVGYWIIKQSASSEVTMTEEDAKAMGLNEIGSVRLDKSGDCRIVILNDEYEGKWTSDDNGTITISYGEEQTLTATINEEGVMTAQDNAMIEYTLEK